jgi:hypothetical protein
VTSTLAMLVVSSVLPTFTRMFLPMNFAILVTP